MKRSLVLTVLILLVCAAIFISCSSEKPTQTTAKPSVTTPSVTTLKSNTSVAITTTNSSIVTTANNQGTTTGVVTTSGVTTAPVTLSEFDATVSELTYLIMHEPLKLVNYRDPASDEVISNVFSFSFKSEGKYFLVDDVDDSGAVTRYGLSYTKPKCIFIKDLTNDGEYVKYDVEYYTTELWYKIFFKPVDFTPVDGTTYDVICAIDIDDPDGFHTMDTPGFMVWEEYTYEEADPVTSLYIPNVSDVITDINQRKVLIQHEGFALQSDGSYRFSIKTDDGEFSDSGENYGISYLNVVNCYVNGDEVECHIEKTENWYVIFFAFESGLFSSGEEYEILIALDATDGGAYTNFEGYYILETYVCP